MTTIRQRLDRIELAARARVSADWETILDETGQYLDTLTPDQYARVIEVASATEAGQDAPPAAGDDGLFASVQAALFTIFARHGLRSETEFEHYYKSLRAAGKV